MSDSVSSYLSTPMTKLRDDNGELIPHVFSFSSILNTVSKTYSYRWDEAVRHNPENALAMRRDCYIESLMQERSAPTVNREWSIEGDNTNDPVQKACGSHLKKIVEATPRFRRMLDYLNAEGVWYGRYGSQVVHKQKKILGIDRWCVVKHKPVNGDKIQGAWDDTPAILINPMLAEKYGDSVVTGDRNPMLLLHKRKWRDQFIIHTYKVRDADYFDGEMAGVVQGEGLRSKIYWAWWLRDEMLSWAVDFMKKVGTMGLLIFPFEMSNPTSKAMAEENAKKASQSTAIVMPVYADGMRHGMDLKPIHIPASQYGVDALQHMIAEYFERHMERLIVGQSMSSGGGGGGGLEGDGRAEFAKDTKFQLLQFDADNLAETLSNDLLGPLMRLNFPQYDFPMRFKIIVPDPDSAGKLQAAQTVVGMGVAVKEDQVREFAGLEKPEPDDKTVGSIEQLYAAHGEMKYLTPRGGLSVNNAAAQPDASGDPQDGNETIDETDEPMRLAESDWPDEYDGGFRGGVYRDQVKDPEDWKPTKSGKGEYSASGGMWRPRGSKLSERHSQTNEIGARIGMSHSNNMRAILAKLENGKHDVRTASRMADVYHDSAVEHETRNFKARFARLKDQLAENHDDGVFKSPEWTAVKEAHRDGLDSVTDALREMTDRAKHHIETTKGKKGEVLDRSHAEHVDDARSGEHRDAHHAAVESIYESVKAFVDKHGRGKGGMVRLSNDEFPELFKEYDHSEGGFLSPDHEQTARAYDHMDKGGTLPGSSRRGSLANHLQTEFDAHGFGGRHRKMSQAILDWHDARASGDKPPKHGPDFGFSPSVQRDGRKPTSPFGSHSSTGKWAERQAAKHGLDASKLHDWAASVHAEAGHEEHTKETAKAAYQSAIGDMKRTNKSGNVVPELVKDGEPPMAEPVPGKGPVDGTASAGKDFEVGSKRPDGSRVGGYVPPKEKQPDGASPGGDWRRTRSGRGEYSPATGKWRPAGGEPHGKQGMTADEHAREANKHAEMRDSHAGTMLGVARGLKSDPKFMAEASGHLRLGSLMSGGKITTHDLHDLHDELGEMKHPAAFAMHALVGRAVDHHERHKEAKFHHENWKAEDYKPPAAPPASGGHPFGPHSDVGRESERQAKAEGMNPAHVHQLAKNYHETTGMHPTAAYRAAIDNFRLGRSTWAGSGAQAKPASGKAAPPPRPPEAGGKAPVQPGVSDPKMSGGTSAGPARTSPDPTKPPTAASGGSNIGKTRGKWTMEARKAGIDSYTLHNRAGARINGGMDHEKAYQEAFDELKPKEEAKKPEPKEESDTGIFDPKNKPAEHVNLDEQEATEKPAAKEKPASKAPQTNHLDAAMGALKDHADMIRQTHNDDVDEHNTIVSHAENQIAKNWMRNPAKYPHPSVVRKKINNGHIEQHDDIPGLDTLAEELANSHFPHRFKKSQEDGGANNADLAGQLFDMLRTGKRKRMNRDDAESAALEHLAKQHEDSHGDEDYVPKPKTAEDEEIPFADVSFVDFYELIDA